MACECVDKINERLKSKHLALKMHMVVDTVTYETHPDMAIETVSNKKGVKPIKLFFAFCPFCGVKK